MAKSFAQEVQGHWIKDGEKVPATRYEFNKARSAPVKAAANDAEARKKAKAQSNAEKFKQARERGKTKTKTRSR